MRKELNFNLIGIYSNKERDSGHKMASEAAKFLTSRGINARLADDDAITADMDCIITFGGDGTLLRAAKKAALNGTPIMGINLGRMGYLTDAGADDAFGALNRLLSGEYILEKRIMLEAGKSIALNDALVSHSGLPKALLLRVEINGEHMDTYQADGILVSTPTGSTAYNLSAGGPVIKPDVEVLAITPVCPHALHLRSAVVAPSDEITVQVLSTGGALFMDGVNAGEIETGGKIKIQRSKYYTTIIKTQKKGFYDILRDKMNWN